MHDAISLNTPDGRSIALRASRIVGIYPARLGTIVALERDGGREWSEIAVGDPSHVVLKKWQEATTAGVSCLKDWPAIR